jgi:DNA-binding transcriptional ArsR family regulator
VARLDATGINELHARVCRALADPKRLLIDELLMASGRSATSQARWGYRSTTSAATRVCCATRASSPQSASTAASITH